MILWTDKEKAVLLKENTSSEAIKKYYEVFPQSNRVKSSLYTYWWWRKQEEKKKFEKSSSELEKVEPEVVHARIVEANIFEPGDSVRYTRGSLLLSPIGVVIDASKRKSIPERSQKMQVRFDNYNVRDVYCCDYTIVLKGGRG
jgi:hypothetical protein